MSKASERRITRRLFINGFSGSEITARCCFFGWKKAGASGGIVLDTAARQEVVASAAASTGQALFCLRSRARLATDHSFGRTRQARVSGRKESEGAGKQ